MGGFDDLEAKAREEGGKLEDEAKQKGEQEVREHAPEYEQKAKDYAENEAKEIEEKF